VCRIDVTPANQFPRLGGRGPEAPLPLVVSAFRRKSHQEHPCQRSKLRQCTTTATGAHGRDQTPFGRRAHAALGSTCWVGTSGPSSLGMGPPINPVRFMTIGANLTAAISEDCDCRGCCRERSVAASTHAGCRRAGIGRPRPEGRVAHVGQIPADFEQIGPR
jgi:hypothetical protein